MLSGIYRFITVLTFGLLILPMRTTLQAQEANYEESKVPEYTLPDPLTLADGSRVSSPSAWENRREQLLGFFTEHVYGKAPGQPENLRFKIQEVDKNALGGTATRKQVTVSFGRGKKEASMDVLIYLPNDQPRPVPLFVGPNFYGNHTIHSDAKIRLTNSWIRNNEEFGITDNRATEASRGVRNNRWPVEQILERGYGLATVYYGDIDPDYDDGFQNGVHSLFYEEGQSQPAAGEWGSIAAWAWGLSRAMDYFVTDKAIDNDRVAVMGHSRLGKTSLWAGAQDKRFALVVSNNSGCGGAALSRRQFGETVKRINTSFPHWFCDNFTRYNDNESELPVDQHMLLALMAPRPVYVASAKEDQWADPHGEFLSAKHASPVYELIGSEGLPAKKMPAVGQPVMGAIGYHIRPGGHDVKDYDWQRFMDFADKHLEK